MICATASMPSPNRSCRTEGIGPGVDPRFAVELIREGQIAAVISRVGLDQFAPERLEGKTAEDVEWLGRIATRHHEIICQAAASAAVLPLRLGTMFHSRDSLQAMLVRCRSIVAEFSAAAWQSAGVGSEALLGEEEGKEAALSKHPSGRSGKRDCPSSRAGTRGPAAAAPPWAARHRHGLPEPEKGPTEQPPRSGAGRVHQTIQNVEQHLAGQADTVAASPICRAT